MEKIEEKARYCLNCKTKPCQTGCPLGNDIPSFIQKIKEEEYEQAYEILSQTTVLSAVCGRICPHMSQCRGKCVRGIKGEPVSIGKLEAFVADWAMENKDKISTKHIENNNKKVLVVGSGPSGLTCAAFLAQYGFSVTLWERKKSLGGILKYGIPEFRLERETLEKTIEEILALGINVVYERELGKQESLKELKKEYDAIFLGIGANIPCKMGIPGEELKGVYGGNTLLENMEHPNYVGKKVAIIGGGNVAIDCARTIKRMGAQEVSIIYRRAEEQMPAEKKEIEEAKQEGIKFLFQNNIIGIQGNENGEVKNIECIKTKLVQIEGENRKSPINIEGSNYEKDMDYVVMAVGSKSEQSIVGSLGLEVDQKGYIIVDKHYETSQKGVFAGGDIIGQKATVAWAARTGREAAKAIRDRFN